MTKKKKVLKHHRSGKIRENPKNQQATNFRPNNAQATFQRQLKWKTFLCKTPLSSCHSALLLAFKFLCLFSLIFLGYFCTRYRTKNGGVVLESQDHKEQLFRGEKKTLWDRGKGGAGDMFSAVYRLMNFTCCTTGALVTSRMHAHSAPRKYVWAIMGAVGMFLILSMMRTHGRSCGSM